MTTGHCKHGEFILTEGCPQCIAERRGVKQDEGILEVGATPEAVARAEETIPEIIIVCAGGCGKTTEGLTIETRTGEFAQVDESGVPQWTCQDCVAKRAGPGEPGANTYLAEPQPQTAVVKIAPDKDEGYINLLAETTKLLAYSTKLVIKGVEDKKAATNDLIIMGDLSKQIEAIKKEWLGPIDEHRKAVFDKFKQLTDSLGQAIKQTKGAMIEYDLAEERKRLELEAIARQERELEEAKARAEGREPTEVKTVAVPEQDSGRTRSELGLASTVTTYKATVIDFSLLSDDYKMPDMAKLNRVANAAKGKIEIPGVKIEAEHNLRTSRTRTAR